tara:strand:+ start:15569 stop:15904 length:336 start_codon:yes stop_codon:yes gene_type:complete
MKYFIVTKGESLNSFTQPNFVLESDYKVYDNVETLIKDRLIKYMKTFYHKFDQKIPPEVYQIENMIIGENLNYNHWGSVNCFLMSGYIKIDMWELIVSFHIQKQINHESKY